MPGLIDVAFKDLLGRGIDMKIDAAAIFTHHEQAIGPSIIWNYQMESPRPFTRFVVNETL